jgi:FkbM family methyltransferase
MPESPRHRFKRLGWARDWARQATDLAGLASDPRSFVELLRLRLASPGPRRLRLKPLDGHPVWLRPGAADYWALDSLDPPVHLPPAEIPPEEILAIWDLGANIGLTMCHLALFCPAAKVVGVEMAAGNAALCRANLAQWSGRCELVEAAVWDADGSVTYDGCGGGQELGFHVGESTSAGSTRAPAICLNTLLERHGPKQTIDYVKMDIEGAEQRVLATNTDWADRVRSIKVEVHPPYTVAECTRDLERLAFRTYVDPQWEGRHGMPPVVGIKDVNGVRCRTPRPRDGIREPSERERSR